jgi:hypothetical protein
VAKAYVAWWRVRRAYDPDAYLRRILVNTSNRRFRKRRVTEQPGDVPETPVDGPADQVRERAALLAALRQLPPRQRAVIVLRATLSDGSSELVTPRVVAGRKYVAFIVADSPRLTRLAWLNAAGQTMASTTGLPRYGYTQFQP